MRRDSDRLEASRLLADRGWGQAPTFAAIEESDPLGLADVEKATEATPPGAETAKGGPAIVVYAGPPSWVEVLRVNGQADVAAFFPAEVTIRAVQSLRAHRTTLGRLAGVYKRINAPLGRFGLAVIAISMRPSGAATGRATRRSRARSRFSPGERDPIADQMRTLLDRRRSTVVRSTSSRRGTHRSGRGAARSSGLGRLVGIGVHAVARPRAAPPRLPTPVALERPPRVRRGRMRPGIRGRRCPRSGRGRRRRGPRRLQRTSPGSAGST
jgi:hypothetical protein